jgi:hypothetical protein
MRKDGNSKTSPRDRPQTRNFQKIFKKREKPVQTGEMKTEKSSTASQIGGSTKLDFAISIEHHMYFRSNQKSSLDE